MFKLFNTVLITILIFLATASFVHAADLTITCENDGSCDLSPNPGDALFDSSELTDEGYPLTDLKPGDHITRSITAINNGNNSCDLQLISSSITTDTQPSGSSEYFSEKLLSAINDGASDVIGQSSSGQAVGPTSLYDILTSTSSQSLGTISSGGTETFSWMITFDYATGNPFQGAELNFDFDMIFNCLDDPSPSPSPSPSPTPDPQSGKTSSLSKDGPLCSDNSIFTTYTAREDGSPVQGISVTFFYNGGTQTAITDVNGEAKVQNYYGIAGPITALASDGYPSQSVTIEELDCSVGTGGGEIQGASTQRFFAPLTGFVQGITDKQEELEPEDKGSDQPEKPEAILGATDEKQCCQKIEPWWWILLIDQVAAIIWYLLRKFKTDKQQPKGWFATISIMTIGYIILHFILSLWFVSSLGYEKHMFTNWFWLISALITAIISIQYYWATKEDQS